MARHRDTVTADEIETAREEMEAQRRTIREVLAEAVGGEPEDYDSTRYFQQHAHDSGDEAVPDGGE